MNSERYLVDSSAVVRFLIEDDARHTAVKAAVASLAKSGAILVVTPQVIRESWAVLTRPLPVNGYGLEPTTSARLLELATKDFSFASDTPEIYTRWLDLVTKLKVSGKQVHDAYHVAAMLVHGIGKVLTLDKRDFARFSEIQAVFPEGV